MLIAGRGAGAASGSTNASGLVFSGSGSSWGNFEVLPDLGSALGSSSVLSEVFFDVTGSSVSYTLVANLSGDYESPDQVQLRRLDSGPWGAQVALANSVNPNLNTSGTLPVGQYRLFADVKASEAGGIVQLSGSESVEYNY